MNPFPVHCVSEMIEKKKETCEDTSWVITTRKLQVEHVVGVLECGRAVKCTVQVMPVSTALQ